MAKALRTRKEFGPYIRLIADKLRLQDWEFPVDEIPPKNEDALAVVSLTYGRKVGVIFLADRTLEADSIEQRHTVVHELVHAHFHLLDFLVGIKKKESRNFRAAVEYAVDGLADAIAPLMPLPGARPK